MPLGWPVGMGAPALPAAGALPGVGPCDIAPFAKTMPVGIESSEDGLDPGNPEALDVLGVTREGLLEDAATIAFRGGEERLVDRFMISFPCTTRLSLDFFRSRVSISIIPCH
jgi:hypothetical protein